MVLKSTMQTQKKEEEKSAPRRIFFEDGQSRGCSERKPWRRFFLLQMSFIFCGHLKLVYFSLFGRHRSVGLASGHPLARSPFSPPLAINHLIFANISLLNFCVFFSLPMMNFPRAGFNAKIGSAITQIDSDCFLFVQQDRMGVQGMFCLSLKMSQK